MTALCLNCNRDYDTETQGSVCPHESGWRRSDRLVFPDLKRPGVKVFILEWSGCECGGAEKIAFTSREKAEQWIAKNSHEVPLGGGRSFTMPNPGHDGWEILEVDLV